MDEHGPLVSTIFLYQLVDERSIDATKPGSRPYYKRRTQVVQLSSVSKYVAKCITMVVRSLRLLPVRGPLPRRAVKLKRMRGGRGLGAAPAWASLWGAVPLR